MSRKENFKINIKNSAGNGTKLLQNVPHVQLTDSARYSYLIVHAARKCGSAAVVVRGGRGTLLLPGVNEPPDAAAEAERGPVLQQGRLSHPLVVYPHLRARAARGHCTKKKDFLIDMLPTPS